MVRAITISRQYGSGGRKIAAHVCELLGYRFFDKLFAAQVAATVGLLEEDVITSVEKHDRARAFLERVTATLPTVTMPNAIEVAVPVGGAGRGRVWSAERLNEAQYVGIIKDAITAAYEQGDVVIVGRGGQVILRDKPDVLHVRIEAPTEMRLWRLREFEGLSTIEAQHQIAKHDQDSSKYMEHFFNVRWNDPLLYHLVINTGKWAPEAATNVIVEAANQL